MTDPRPRKPETGNPRAGKLTISRDYYERTMRALGKEPKPPGSKMRPPSTGAGSHD